MCEENTMALDTMAARWTRRAVWGGAVAWRPEAQEGAGMLVLGRVFPEARMKGAR